MSESTEPKNITVKIKTTSTVHEITVKEDANVKDLKEALVEKLHQPIDRLTLIFSGKILKDGDFLAGHSIKDGVAVHLVVRNPVNQALSSTSATASGNRESSNAPPHSGATAQHTPFTAPFNSMMGGQAAMAQQLLNNPEAMSQMMNSPIMQSLISNPQVLRSILTENPQFQQLIESNPELGHILNDPEMMRQTMEMVRNPNMFHEMMRNHDQAIRNLQGIPGGEAALQRLYQEVQEPLLNSATSSLAGNPFAALQNSSGNAISSRSQRAGVENADPLPNPWGASPASGRETSGNANDSDNAVPDMTAGLGNFLDSPGMQSVMNQMLSDPTIVSSLMTPEAMQGARQMMSSNPQLVQSMLRSNPVLAANPQLAAQLPQLMNPETIAEVMQSMNPRVIAAMQQIQQGIEVLRTEMPQFANMFGGMESQATQGSATTASSTAGESATADSRPVAGGMTAEALRTLMQMMHLGGGANALTDNQRFIPPVNAEEQFAAQLEQLQQMGFTNRAENIAALLATFGDVNAAIERLLQH